MVTIKDTEYINSYKIDCLVCITFSNTIYFNLPHPKAT